MPLLKLYKFDEFQKFFSRLEVLAPVLEVFRTFSLKIGKIGINRVFVVTDGRGGFYHGIFRERAKRLNRAVCILYPFSILWILAISLKA